MMGGKINRSAHFSMIGRFLVSKLSQREDQNFKEVEHS